MFGWNSFAKARPNAAHFALADLEAAGKVNGVITQVGVNNAGVCYLHISLRVQTIRLVNLG